MRNKIIGFLKIHPRILECLYATLRGMMCLLARLLPTKKKVIFVSLGGRKFDDSPRAIYEEMIQRKCFQDWEFVWAFVDTEEHEIPRGRKVKIDTVKFFYELLTSKIWIGNSGIDRGIGIKKKGCIHVETWHGTPIKKICGEENSVGMPSHVSKKKDSDTIRCAQCTYEKEIFERVFHASEESIILCGMPRNDSLITYRKEDITEIRRKLKIPPDKKILLYTPTYREYLIDKDNLTYLRPPINLKKWKENLENEYVMLIRAHYAVVKSLEFEEDDFVRDVSNYPVVNDLYLISDMMISDYSGTFVDFSILERPMFCFAYDYEEYNEKRGLYIDLEDELPCKVTRNEDELLDDIVNVNMEDAARRTKEFHMKYAPIVGRASVTMVDEIERRITR